MRRSSSPPASAPRSYQSDWGIPEQGSPSRCTSTPSPRGRRETANTFLAAIDGRGTLNVATNAQASLGTPKYPVVTHDSAPMTADLSRTPAAPEAVIADLVPMGGWASRDLEDGLVVRPRPREPVCIEGPAGLGRMTMLRLRILQTLQQQGALTVDELAAQLLASGGWGGLSSRPTSSVSAALTAARTAGLVARATDGRWELSSAVQSVRDWSQTPADGA